MNSDPFNLQRFLDAQQRDYARALTELRAGRKRSHWMWYVFPQIDGLARSATSHHYAIKSEAEARAYLADPVLGTHLYECAEALLQLQGHSASVIFGFPDDLKLRSCMTLFAQISPPDSLFAQVLERYFHGECDTKTLAILHKGI